jgi:hypothetical protein
MLDNEHEQDDKKKTGVANMDTLNNIKLSCTVTCIAKRNQGKSFCVQSLVYNWLKSGRLKSHNIILFSSTSATNGEYDWLPPENRRYGYDETLLKQVIQWQKRRILLLQKKARTANVKVTMPGILLIIDDVLTSSGKNNHVFSPTLKYLFCQSRHFYISIIFCSQLAKVIASPTIKSQSDYILISQLSAEQLKAVYSVTSGFKNVREFQSRVASLEDHTFLLYDTLKTKGDRWSEVRATGFNEGKFRLTYKNHNQKKKKIKKEGEK